jgi:hypothetical protein
VVGLAGNASSFAQMSKDSCGLVTRAQAAAALGAPVDAGEMAMAGCQWTETGGNGYVQVQIARAKNDQQPPKTAHMLSGIGLQAYAYTELDAPHAMARTNNATVVVWAWGPHATSEKVVELLRTVVNQVE